MSLFRHCVAGKKNMYTINGYDLNLVYITPKIIMAGYPATGCEAIYRNNSVKMFDFLEQYHKNHYYVFNLCAEKNRQYDPRIFRNRVYLYPVTDHYAPPLQLIMDFCKKALQLLQEHNKNTLLVHCKAGQGRTGVFVNCLLLYLQFVQEKQLSIEIKQDLFDMLSRKRGEKVKIASQLRAINNFYELLNSTLLKHQEFDLYDSQIRQNLKHKYDKTLQLEHVSKSFSGISLKFLEKRQQNVTVVITCYPNSHNIDLSSLKQNLQTGEYVFETTQIISYYERKTARGDIINADQLLEQLNQGYIDQMINREIQFFYPQQYQYQGENQYNVLQSIQPQQYVTQTPQIINQSQRPENQKIIDVECESYDPHLRYIENGKEAELKSRQIQFVSPMKPLRDLFVKEKLQKDEATQNNSEHQIQQQQQSQCNNQTQIEQNIKQQKLNNQQNLKEIKNRITKNQKLYQDVTTHINKNYAQYVIKINQQNSENVKFNLAIELFDNVTIQILNQSKKQLTRSQFNIQMQKNFVFNQQDLDKNKDIFRLQLFKEGDIQQNKQSKQVLALQKTTRDSMTVDVLESEANQLEQLL